MADQPLARKTLILAIFFGLLDLITAGIFVPLLPKFYIEFTSGFGLPRVIAGLKILLIILLFCSATGHFLRRRWGCTLYFWQMPLRLLTNIFSLSALLYLIPYIGDNSAAAGLHLAVVSLEWLRVFLTVGLRKKMGPGLVK